MSCELLESVDLPTERLPLTQLTPPWLQTKITCTPSFSSEVNKADPAIKVEAERVIRDHSATTDICVYTDGSATGGFINGGSAAIFTMGDPSAPVRLKTLMQPAGAACSSYTCELLAIKIALEECVTHHPHANILIVSDSQSAISAIQGGAFAPHPYVADISRLASDLQLVHATYCPSHIGVIGNEWADVAANTAATMDQHNTAVDFQSSKRHIIRSINNPAPTHHLTSEVFKEGFTKRNFLPNEVDRKEMRRIRCGHSKLLAAYRNRLDPSASDSCRFCDDNPETITHLLRCPALAIPLQQQFGEPEAPVSTTATDEIGAHAYLCKIGVIDADLQ
jgi:ribonuclease HI